MKNIFYIAIPCFLLIATGCETEKIEKTEIKKGYYLGEVPPGNEPVLFCPDIFGQGKEEFGLIFSGNGKEIFFDRLMGINPKFTLVYTTMNEDETWTEIAVMPFSGKYNDANPHLANDDNRLYFTSRRPVIEEDPNINKALDIWYVDRTETGWSKPVNLGAPVNLTDSREDYPFVYEDKIYFQSDRVIIFDSVTGFYKRDRDLYCADIVNGEYVNARNLGDSINSYKHEESNMIITEDEVMFFTSERSGIQDIYYSKKNENGIWKKARKLGPEVNTEFMDGQPKVSPDNQYFFYTRRFFATRNTYWVRLDHIYSELEY